MPDLSSLVKKTDYDAKLVEVEGKYFSSCDYNKFSTVILDAKIKQKGLVNKSDISNLVKNSVLNTKLAILSAKAELKAKQDKIVKLQSVSFKLFSR